MTEPIKLPELFVVRHYGDDERPSIKGNGFDGLTIGEDREEAEQFVAWVNARLAVEQNTAELRAEVDRLRAALTGLVDFVDGPAEGKRPDVFALLMNSARAALKEPK
jgi:hypothetical protein